MKRKFRRFKKMPKKGQFIRMWIYRGHVWSEVLRWNDEHELEVYDQALDEWVDPERPILSEEHECEYLVPNW